MRLSKKKFRANIKENQAFFGPGNMREESKIFYEMLTITFSNKVDQYEELRNRYKVMLDNMESEMWHAIGENISMLIEELHCFLEIMTDLNAIQSLWDQNVSTGKNLTHQINGLMNSQSDTVGFFTKVPKSQKIQEYRNQLKEAEELDEVYRKMLIILSRVILNTQTDTIRERKRVRYALALKTFAEKKKKILEDTLNFWSNIQEDYQTGENMHTRLGSLRFTR